MCGNVARHFWCGVLCFCSLSGFNQASIIIGHVFFFEPWVTRPPPHLPLLITVTPWPIPCRLLDHVSAWSRLCPWRLCRYFLPPNIESSKSTFSSNTNFQRVPLRSVRSTPSRTLSAPDAVSDLSIARRRLAPLADTPPPRSDPTTGVRRPSDDTPPVPVECDLSSSLTESSETVSATRLPSKLTSRLIKN